MHHSLPLHALEAKIPGTCHSLMGVLDSGSEVVAIPKRILEELRLPLCSNHVLQMMSVNTSVDLTIGVLENIALDFGAGEVLLQVQIMGCTNFDLLLGQPFHCLMSVTTKDSPDGAQLIMLRDPNMGSSMHYLPILGSKAAPVWFCILKQDGTSLCLIHNLQPLNAVTIQDLSTPPFVKHLAESFTRYAVYGMMDLFTGYDQRPLHPDSWDLTTFNSPLGPHCLMMIPMGYTNVVQIYQADMSFILQDKILHYSYPFIDDLPVKSVTTQYENLDGSYETIPDNLGIRCFIWEHLQVVHRILQ